MATPNPFDQFDAPQAPPPVRPPPTAQPSAWDGIKSFLDKYGPQAAPEAALAIGGNMISTPLAGIAGVGTAATNALGLTNTPAADVVNGIQGAVGQWTAPRTTGGKAVLGVASYPFEKLAQGADAVGDMINQPGVMIPTPYGTIQGGSLPATIANTAIQAAPSLLFEGIRGRGAVAETPAAKVAKETQVAKEAEAKAQDYVRSNTSLDWNKLSVATKARLSQIAKDAGNLDLLDSAALERQARLESLPAPVSATRGQLTRDPVQLRNEGNVSATEAGKPIRQTYMDQTQALLKNLDILKGKVSGTGERAATAQTPEQVGLSVQDSALREKAAASKRKYDFLYKKARATEPEAAVNSAPLRNMLDRNPELQHLGFMKSWFSKAGVDGPTKQVKLADLQDLRTKATGIAKAGGTDGYYAGQVVGAIDEAMTQVPAAAKAWKEAQGAFKKHKTEFEEQGAVEKLVTDKSRTDRATALENTWQSVVKGGSIEDLQKVKRSLLTGEDAKARNAGIKAWRDVRAQTVQHIINEATKSVTRYEDGTPNLTPASMERAIKGIGEEKLREIFGDSTVKQLNDIMEATRLVKTEPPTGFKGSPTLANTIALLEKSIGKVPFLGDATLGTIKVFKNVKDLGANTREVSRAASSPLDEAASQAARKAGQRNMQSNYGNYLRATAPLAETGRKRQ